MLIAYMVSEGLRGIPCPPTRPLTRQLQRRCGVTEGRLFTYLSGLLFVLFTTQLQAQTPAERGALRLMVMAEPPTAQVIINGVPRGVADGSALHVPVGQAIALKVRIEQAGFVSWESTLPPAALQASSLYLFRRLIKAEPLPPPTPGYCGLEASRETLLQQVKAEKLNGNILDQLRACLEKDARWSEAIVVTKQLCALPDRLADCRFALGKYYREAKQMPSCAKEMQRVINSPIGLSLCFQLKAY